MTTLETALRALVPFAAAHGFDAEAVIVRLEAEKSSPHVARAVGDAMVTGQLTTNAWREAASSSLPDDFIAAMGTLWDALCRAGLARSVDGFPESWTQETLRLWAYTENWLITSEDEDCALMTEEFAPALLALASEPACPKREYALGLVRSWARNTARSAAGHDSFRAVVTRLATHAPAARNANDVEFADYLLRLATYADDAPVDREAAYQRALDLAPHHEPKAEDVKVEEEALCFRLETFAAKPLHVRKSDGRMF